jgi:hypothetical protein
MSEAFSPYYDGNDYIEEDEKTSIDKKWDIKLPDGTWVSWRGNVFNYDHLCHSLTPMGLVRRCTKICLTPLFGVFALSTTPNQELLTEGRVSDLRRTRS